MPETPEELYDRVKDSLRMPPVEEWDTFPFDGEMTPRALQPPVDREEPRFGEGGVDCKRCTAPDDEYIWTSERWRLLAVGPTGLPFVAAELGVLLARIERAIRSIGDIGRVHVCRWGDGGEHLHWWFMTRPARTPQLIGSFAAIWDDILPPVPEEIWRENVDAVVAALEE